MDIDSKSLVDEVFLITGAKMSEGDPVILAALFYSHKMREAADAAAMTISDATTSASSTARAAEEAARSAGLLCERLEADRAALAAEFAKGRATMLADFATERFALTSQQTLTTRALVGAIGAQVKQAVRDTGGVQSTHEGLRPDWRILLAAMTFGAFFTGGAISVACNFSFSWIADARLGAQMKRAFPHFDPVVQDKIIHYFEKPKK